MTTYQLLTLLGVGSIATAVITFLMAWPKKVSKRIKAISSGVQAMLRSQMVDMYNKYKNLGYAPIYAKQNFENLWVNYEALGQNGVMKGIHDEFMSMPHESSRKGDSK